MSKGKNTKRLTSLAKVGTFLVVTSSIATGTMKQTNKAIAQALEEATFGKKKTSKRRTQRRKTKKRKRKRRKKR